MDLFDATGRRISLGRKIGSGGEGAVYEVPVLGSDHVAKVYHGEISHEKQAKLQGMAAGSDDSLKRIAAWPTATLHVRTDGPIRGFVMPKVVGYEPIHHLYGPSHRKQRFPNADWAFLVNTARNVAAAFEAIHAHGHVIGDVNPNLVYVANSTIVKLIDCDSFQVAANGKHYLCEVGVPHFTPPELQANTSFRGVRRTQNHDNFGLALLIFHVLMMGRHPFSGVFAGKGDMPLEKAIAQFRYAFGQNAAAKGMSPPPNSVTTAILPSDVTMLFELAFTESGAQTDGRPHPRDWVRALESLKGQLRACGHESMHRYFGGLSGCPWCAQEQQAGIYFFIGLISASASSSVFSIGLAWARITAVEAPTPAPTVDFSKISPTPRPLPPELERARMRAVFQKILAAVVVIGWIVITPKWAILALIVGGVIWSMGTVDDSGERKVRRDAHTLAEQKWKAAERHWQQEAGDGGFQAKLKELMALRTEYEGLASRFGAEKQKLQQNLKSSQLHKFLDQFFVENFNIPGIGATRKATLASFGIETAADVSWAKINNIRGFGDKLTREMVDWRNGLERRFVFDPTKGADPAEVAALNQRFALRRKQLEGGLLAGPEALVQIRNLATAQRQRLRAMILTAAQELAQAQADLRVLGL